VIFGVFSLAERQRSSDLIFWPELQHPLLILCDSWNWFLQRPLIGQLELGHWAWNVFFSRTFPSACNVCVLA
jgi:hypothetical protein